MVGEMTEEYFERLRSEHREKAQLCSDCEELISDFENNFLEIRKRKCFFCMIYIEREKPCDECGAPAKWFYFDPRPGRRGLCDSCAPDELKSTFE